jgi:type IV secretory pathway VirB4 component
MDPNAQFPSQGPGMQPNVPPGNQGAPQATPPAFPGMQPGVSMPQPTQPAKVNPNSTQNTLLIAEIRDGIVIMNDGSFRAVTMVKSINFDLMSAQEREAVEYSYQGFLNSLYFPIQIFVRSQKVDIRPYIERLSKVRSEQENMLLGMLMDDYVQFIADLSQQTNIMDKRFFIVVPYYTVAMNAQKAVESGKRMLGGLFSKKQQVVTINEADLAKAKTELANRVQAVVNGLAQINIHAIPLDTQELISLYYEAYGHDSAGRQELVDMNQLTAPVITKGQGNAPQPHLDRELE